MDLLPAGFGLSLDPAVRRIDGGIVIVGGTPLRLLRLTPSGARLVDRLSEGNAVPASAGAQRLARRMLDAGIAHPRPPRGGFTASDVTVVIPVRDQPAGLATTLASLGAVGNVVVVDDGSRDAVAGAVRHPVARGPGAARNTGWSAATTALVAFVDAECSPVAGWLDHLLPHFADPLVAAVAPRITASPGPGVLAAYESARSPLDRGPSPAPVRPRGRVPFVPTAVLVVRREALEELGGFDETLRFGEDVDLVWRIVSSGKTVRYEPATVATHPPRSSWRAWLRQRFEYGSSAAPLARRHQGAVAPLAVSSWSALSWGLTALGWPVAGAGVAAVTTAMLEPRMRGLSHPWREAGRLAGRGHLHAGTQMADAVRRVWWPLALVGALASRRVRRAVVGAVAIPLATEWISTRPPLDPLRWAALRLADDMAYGAGVWAGCFQSRSFAALAPDLSSWPGRHRAVEPA